MNSIPRTLVTLSLISVVVLPVSVEASIARWNHVAEYEKLIQAGALLELDVAYSIPSEITEGNVVAGGLKLTFVDDGINEKPENGITLIDEAYREYLISEETKKRSVNIFWAERTTTTRHIGKAEYYRYERVLDEQEIVAANINGNTKIGATKEYSLGTAHDIEASEPYLSHHHYENNLGLDRTGWYFVNQTIFWSGIVASVLEHYGVGEKYWEDPEPWEKYENEWTHLEKHYLYDEIGYMEGFEIDFYFEEPYLHQIVNSNTLPLHFEGIEGDALFLNAELWVQYDSKMIPEPTAMCLVGTGLLGLVGIRRRIRYSPKGSVKWY